MLFRQRYKLSIPEPCHEDWNKMHPVDRGRFCDSCTKVVTDFSQMTENEIATFFRSKPQNACGRFKSSQLDKTYISPVNITIPVHKRLIRCVMSVFLMGSAVKEMKSQSQDTAVVQNDSLQNDSLDNIAEVIQKDSLLPDSSAVADVDSIKPNLEVTSEVEVCGIYAGLYRIEITEAVYGNIGYYPPEYENLLFPDFKRAFNDTAYWLLEKLRKEKKKEPDLALEEQKEKVPDPTPKPIPTPKSEAVLPSFFSLRGRNSGGEQKKS